MTTLPGWDSIDEVTKIHRFFEIAGIVCLAALVVTEALAYIYNRRKDVLAESIESKKRQDDQTKEGDFNTRLGKAADEAREAKERQALAEKELSKLRANANPRAVSAIGRNQLIQQLAQHPDYIAELSAVPDAEAMQLSERILEILMAAKWNVGTYSRMTNATGQSIIYSIPDPQHPTDPEHALIEGFRKAGMRITVNAGTDNLLVGFRVPE